MRIKINNGTTRSDLDLCKNCVHSRIRKHADNREVRQCNVGSEKSRWANVDGYPVVECSSYYSNTNNISHELAWYPVKRSDGSITFRDPLVPLPHPFAAFKSVQIMEKIQPPDDDDKNNGGGVH